MKSFLSILLCALFISCSLDSEPKKETKTDFTAENEQEITAYIEANNLTATKSTTGLYYVIDEPGTGAQPTANSTVTVSYKGYYTNESVFDESDIEGISFNLQQVIPGWTEGIAYFKEGGSGMLLIPSHLGYGSFDYRGIPGGSVLIFEIELISVD
ncbi:MAG: peptidylprolyl isomerase [Flavobacteriaceae bacterium]|nr:MAG: peptidylprolyl isomerase [Flavobacteriaceae bacterium]